MHSDTASAATDGAQGAGFLSGYSALDDACHPHAPHGPSPFRRLLGMLRPEAAEIRMLVLFSATVGLLALASPIAVEALVNSVAFGGLIQPVVVLSLMLLACLALAAGMTALEFYVVELIQRRLFVRAAARATVSLVQGLRQTGELNAAVLANRFLEVAQIQKITAVLLLDGVSILLTTVIGMIVLAFYHPVLLAFDIGLTSALVILLFGMARRGTRTSIEESLAKHALVRWFEQLAHTSTTFRSRSGGQLAADVAAALTTRYLEKRAEHFRIVFRQLNFGLAVQVLASVMLMGLGGWLVIIGQMTLGQLVAAELIIALITGQLSKIGKYVESYYDLMASVDKLESLLDRPTERDGGEAPDGAPAGASLRTTELGYHHDAGRALFDELEVRAAPGEAVAIVGDEGAGKTKLASLFVGRAQATSGAVEIDGLDVRSWNLPALRDRVALVGGTSVIEATIAENLHLARDDVRPDDMRKALQAVELLDSVMLLPSGLDTRLELDGTPLSRGQVSRLMLARALAGKPRLLLLDGVMDYLDDERRRRIWQIIRRDYPSTVVLLTRSAATARLCDRTYTLPEPPADDVPPPS